MNKRERTPEVIKDIVDRWLKISGIEKSKKKYVIFDIWNKIIDEETKKFTQPISFTAQVLEVSVSNPSYYFELIHFKKMTILKKLQNSSNIFIKDIRFINSGKIQ